jgi:hypothetical protein
MLGLLTSDLAGGLRRQERRRTSRVTAVAVIAALSLGLAACSSSPKAATTTTVKINPAAAQGDISTIYDNLFHLSTGSIASKVAEVQDGPSIKGAFTQAASSSEAAASQGAKIDSVTILTAAKCEAQKLGSQCAKIVYDILGTGGTAILANNNGYAVFIDGKWLVAKVTICTLLGLFYSAEGKTGSPPGC